MSTFMGYSTGYDHIYYPPQTSKPLSVPDSWRPSPLNGKAEYFNSNTTAVGPYQYVAQTHEGTNDLCAAGTSKEAISVKGEVLLHRGLIENRNSSKYAYDPTIQSNQDSPKMGYLPAKCFDTQELPDMDRGESDITESNQSLNIAHQMVQRTVSCHESDVAVVDSQSQQNYALRQSVSDQAQSSQSSNIMQRSPATGLHCRKSDDSESDIFSSSHVNSPRYAVQGRENDTSPFRIAQNSKSPFSFHNRVQGGASTPPISCNSLSLPSENTSLFVNAAYRNGAGETSGSKPEYSHSRRSDEISSHPAESNMLYRGQSTPSREKYLLRHPSFHMGQEQETSPEFTAAAQYEKRHEEHRLTANPFHSGYESQGIGT